MSTKFSTGWAELDDLIVGFRSVGLYRVFGDEEIAVDAFLATVQLRLPDEVDVVPKIELLAAERELPLFDTEIMLKLQARQSDRPVLFGSRGDNMDLGYATDGDIRVTRRYMDGFFTGEVRIDVTKNSIGVEGSFEECWYPGASVLGLAGRPVAAS